MSKIGDFIKKVSEKWGAALSDEADEQEMSEQKSPAAPQPTENHLSDPPEPAEPEAPTYETEHENNNVTQPSSKQMPTEESVKLEDRVGLLRSVIDTLTSAVEFKDTTGSKVLVIWLDCDRLTFERYDTEQYRSQMLSALVNERGYGFEAVKFSIGRPAEDLRATRIGDSTLEFLQIVAAEPETATASRKAIISVFADNGSLLQEQYVISPEDMSHKMINAYNIGAGKFPKLPAGYRENHIAIDDSPTSPMVEKNKYVSRMHAHIGYSEKFGFYLQVEIDGTRLMGKRTRIFRGADKIECDNPQAKVSLQDGDLIELGKAVVLRYVEIKD